MSVNYCSNYGHWTYIYKWKTLFYEMEGDVGMSVHEKERKQEDAYTKTQSHSQPHPYIFVICCLFVCDEFIRQSKQHNILTSNCLHENVCCGLGRNKDVGMGL